MTKRLLEQSFKMINSNLVTFKFELSFFFEKLNLENSKLEFVRPNDPHTIPSLKKQSTRQENVFKRTFLKIYSYLLILLTSMVKMKAKNESPY